MSENEEYLTTKEGLNRLKQELEWRRNVEAKRLGNIMGEMAADGDHRENDGYLVATEMYIVNLEKTLQLVKHIQNAKIVDTDATQGVTFGNKVILEDNKGVKREYEIVNKSEASPTEGKLSHKSPLGKALIGKRGGQKVVFTTPRGKEQLLIVSVS